MDNISYSRYSQNPFMSRIKKSDEHSPSPGFPKLKIGDIILVHTEHDISRALLRDVTESFWDHSALIIFPEKEYFKTNLFIENVATGTSIHRLNKYLDDKEHYAVGIKRFTWLTDEIRERVQAFALLNIDAPYYPWSGFKFFLAKIFPFYRDYLLKHQRYSCTQLVQTSFYEAVEWRDKDRVTFKENPASPFELLELTNPGEIAKSEKCEWIYNKHL